MYSMTGYGKGEYKDNGLYLTVEIKTVNNRYLDLNIKSPKIFSAYEEVIRSLIKAKLSRGHADVFINYIDKREKEKKLFVDIAVAKGYVNAVKTLKDNFCDLTDDFTLTSLLKSPDVLKQEEQEGADEQIIFALKEGLNLALDNLNKMRKVEGEKLHLDMSARMSELERHLSVIKETAPKVAENYKNKLTERVSEYLKDVNFDQTRLLTEVAVFADRSNIDEEMTRLTSHISQFYNICKNEIVGRQLDFLIQEFNREANTICSKSNDLTVTDNALKLKCEIEKIREQVQNLE